MDKQDIATICIIFSAVFALLGFFVRVVGEIDVTGQISMIEQLQDDVRKVSASSNEDVIGQVTQFNQMIVSNKRYRKFWYGRLFIPDEWDSVEVIKIP